MPNGIPFFSDCLVGFTSCEEKEVEHAPSILGQDSSTDHMLWYQSKKSGTHYDPMFHSMYTRLFQ